MSDWLSLAAPDGEGTAGRLTELSAADLLPHIDTSALQPAASLGTNVKDPIHSARPDDGGCRSDGVPEARTRCNIVQMSPDYRECCSAAACSTAWR